MYAWSMATTTRRILTNPLLLFHGNDFYPYGTTKAFSEIIFVPALLSMPVFLLSGNPILSYNIILLLLWSLSGLTMYLCAREIVGHKWGAMLAAAVWTLSPYRTDYYIELNMQMCFAVPLIVLYWYRFLRTQRVRNAVLTCLFFGVQALSCWNYAIMVSLFLVLFSLAYILLKWRGWKIKKLLGIIPVVMIFSVAMLPFIRPYFQVRKLLGIQATLSDSVPRSADVLTYLESGPVGWYHFSPTRHRAETGLFPGFVPVLLFALSFGYLLKRETQFGRSRARRIAGLIAAVGLLFSLLQLGLRAGVAPDALRSLHVMHFATASAWAIGFCLLLLGLRGWNQRRNRIQDRGLYEKEILAIFLFAALVMFLLSLGPVVHVKRQAIGHGPYYRLYDVIFPLRALRQVSRFGALVLFSVGILSGLGMKWVDSTVGRRWKLTSGVMCIAFILAAIEYCPRRLKYDEFRWDERPPVYDFVALDPGDFAIAEWPLGWKFRDADATLWSVAHEKRVLAGCCRWRVPGKMPPRTEQISRTLGALSNPELTAQSMTELRAVYPTKYLILHRAFLRETVWPPWERLLENLPEGLTLLRVYDNQDYLFEICPILERGKEFSREFSFEYVLGHGVARFRLRAVARSPDAHPVKIYFNDRLLCGDKLSGDWKKYEFKLPRPYHKVAPNGIRIVSIPEDGNESQMEFDGFCLSRD
jgi:hypothetical protein